MNKAIPKTNKKYQCKKPFFCFSQKGHTYLKKNFSSINNMNNQNTIQNSPERETKQLKQDQHLITPFQTLKALPTPLSHSQCVLHKHEIIICGGFYQGACYSYHTLKNEYKFICEYPGNVRLWGHCAVKLADSNNKDSNEITLLSFGGYYKHTLVMKYVSVWDNHNNGNEMNKSKKLNKSNNYNQWVPFTDINNDPFIIGRSKDSFQGVRAVIGGSNNHLLFITYLKSNISVFDLNTLQFIKDDILPINKKICYHCF
ncbi:hypothetical protein RFI_34181, partial [Reticulomyxa filosa]